MPKLRAIFWLLISAATTTAIVAVAFFGWEPSPNLIAIAAFVAVGDAASRRTDDAIADIKSS
jgi:hypothetical protein